ncbi:2631_t:CDS:1, partial [Rhizophagus irregularis]
SSGKYQTELSNNNESKLWQKCYEMAEHRTFASSTNNDHKPKQVFASYRPLGLITIL